MPFCQDKLILLDGMEICTRAQIIRKWLFGRFLYAVPCVLPQPQKVRRKTGTFPSLWPERNFPLQILTKLILINSRRQVNMYREPVQILPDKAALIWRVKALKMTVFVVKLQALFSIFSFFKTAKYAKLTNNKKTKIILFFQHSGYLNIILFVLLLILYNMDNVKK